MGRTDQKGYQQKSSYPGITPEIAASGVEGALKVIGGRWKLIILFYLFRDGTLTLFRTLSPCVRCRELGKREAGRRALVPVGRPEPLLRGPDAAGKRVVRLGAVVPPKETAMSKFIDFKEIKSRVSIEDAANLLKLALKKKRQSA